MKVPAPRTFACREVPRRGRPGRTALAAVAAVLTLAAGAAHAGTFGLGLGGGTDQGRTDCVAGFGCDHDDAFGQVFANYRFTDGPVTGLELTVLGFDAGRFSGGDTTPGGTAFGGRFKVSGVALTAGYRWAFAPQWSLLGHAGVASVRTRFSYDAPFSGDVSKTTTQPLVGASLGYDLTPHWRVSADVDVTRFKVHTEQGSLRLYGVSAQYSF